MLKMKRQRRADIARRHEAIPKTQIKMIIFNY